MCSEMQANDAFIAEDIQYSDDLQYTAEMITIGLKI